MKVRYDFEMKCRFAGEIEMTKEEFKRLDAIEDEETLAGEIFELVDSHDVMGWAPDSLLIFESAEKGDN